MCNQSVCLGAPGSPGVAIGDLFAPVAACPLESIPDQPAVNARAEIERLENAPGALRRELSEQRMQTGRELPAEVRSLMDVPAVVADGVRLPVGIMVEVPAAARLLEQALTQDSAEAARTLVSHAIADESGPLSPMAPSWGGRGLHRPDPRRLSAIQAQAARSPRHREAEAGASVTRAAYRLS